MQKSKGAFLVPSGSSLRLYCETEGHPKPKVTWLKGHDLVRKSNERVKLTTNELLIEDIQLEDAGSYICIAENVIGSSNAEIEVNVGSKETYKCCSFYQTLSFITCVIIFSSV